MRRVQIGVSVLDTVYSHSVDRNALIRAGVQTPCHGVTETVRFLCDEAQQVGYL